MSQGVYSYGTVVPFTKEERRFLRALAEREIREYTVETSDCQKSASALLSKETPTEVGVKFCECTVPNPHELYPESWCYNCQLPMRPVTRAASTAPAHKCTCQADPEPIHESDCPVHGAPAEKPRGVEDWLGKLLQREEFGGPKTYENRASIIYEALRLHRIEKDEWEARLGRK